MEQNITIIFVKFGGIAAALAVIVVNIRIYKTEYNSQISAEQKATPPVHTEMEESFIFATIFFCSAA